MHLVRRLLRPVPLLALACVLLAASTTVLAVLYAGDADERRTARMVEVSQQLWDEDLAELRAFADDAGDAGDAGDVWTVPGLRPSVQDDVTTTVFARDDLPADRRTDVLTARDLDLTPCDALGDAYEGVLRCYDTDRGDLSVGIENRLGPLSEDVEAGYVEVLCGEIRTMPGGTDARVEVVARVPVDDALVTRVDEAGREAERAGVDALDTRLPATALTSYVERGRALAEPRLADADLQALDLDDERWTDYEFMYRLGQWDDQPPYLTDAG